MRKKSFAGYNGSREQEEIEIDGRTFLTVDTMNGMKLLDIVASIEGGGTDSGAALIGLIGDIVVESQREDFLSHLRTSSAVDLPLIMELMEWAVERYGERPTEQSSGSTPG